LITTSNNEDPRTIHALIEMSISNRSSVLRWLVQRQQQQQQQQDTMAEGCSLGG
jgi:predicted alpha/beta-fold hydrolase